MNNETKPINNMKMTHMARIVLGTTSRHKIDAVREACKKADIVAEVFGSSAESFQNEQPVGYDATYAGAFARADQARHRDTSAIAIGIESGISFEGGIWNDFAVIVVLEPISRKTIVAETEPFEFPERYVREAEAIGFKTTTVGSVIAKHTRCDPTDPHSFLSDGKVSRSDLLTDALVEAFGKIKKT